MDITFTTKEGKFNHRVAAVIMNKGKLLVMRDNGIGHYYLPGGRVQLHETAEQAVVREVFEELEIKSRIVRPLWIVQSYFSLDTTGEKFHEVAFYYLIDITGCDNEKLAQGLDLELTEKQTVHEFRWVGPEELENMYFYPLFLKKMIKDIPEHPVMVTEFQ